MPGGADVRVGTACPQRHHWRGLVKSCSVPPRWSTGSMGTGHGFMVHGLVELTLTSA